MSSFSLSLDEANAVGWVFGAAAVALSIGRYLIRWKVTKRFYADDIAHLFAVIFMLGELVAFQCILKPLPSFFAWARGQGPEDRPTFRTIQALSVTGHICLFSSLWSVKIAFLLFYRILFKVSKRFTLWFWVVMAFNIITYLVCIIGALVICAGNPANLLDYKVCQNPASLPIIKATYVFDFVAVVSSDIATMILPLVMMRGLQIRPAQKWAISAILCLSSVIIAFETLRIVQSYKAGGELNVLWTHLEMTIAVIVCALPTYYSLHTHRRLRRANGQSLPLSVPSRRFESGMPQHKSKWSTGSTAPSAKGFDDGNDGWGPRIDVSAAATANIDRESKRHAHTPSFIRSHFSRNSPREMGPGKCACRGGDPSASMTPAATASSNFPLMSSGPVTRPLNARIGDLASKPGRSIARWRQDRQIQRRAQSGSLDGITYTQTYEVHTNHSANRSADRSLSTADSEYLPDSTKEHV